VRRTLLRVAAVGAVVFVALQLVPYGWHHPNPPVVADAPWPDARSEELARAACYDCHSNETDWPVYSYVAPMSWLVRRDVEQGRDELNFSDWGDDADEADDAVEQLVDGSMPPAQYVALHPDADLSAEEESQLAAALSRMDEQDDDDNDDNSGRGGD
jgi:Haem-binding domain